MVSEQYCRNLEKSLSDKMHTVSRLKSKAFYLSLFAAAGWLLFIIAHLNNLTT